MLYQNVSIDTIECQLPAEVVSSEDIERTLEPVYQRLKLPFGRLELMSGIRERRFWPKGFRASDAATLAAEKALQKSGFPRESIGCLIMCSVCRDFLEPATAAIVHRNLALQENCQIFDVSNACLGVLNGMVILANMIELGQVEAGILVAGEVARTLVETTINTILEDASLTRKTIKPLFASLTIGSGAVAIIMSRRNESVSTGHQLMGATFLANTAWNHLCQGDHVSSEQILMQTDSEVLLREGVAVAKDNWAQFCRELGWHDSCVDCYCTHQVGAAHRKLLFDRLSLDAAKDYSTLAMTGNVGSVSCPLTVALAAENGVLKSQHKLAMLGIGSGISCAMLGIRW